MNVDRILALAATIEAQPRVEEEDESGFCMSAVLHPCGTPSCIEGYAIAAMMGRGPDDPILTTEGEVLYVPSPQVADWLGLSFVEHHSLCYPLIPVHAGDPYTATPAQAASALRHLAETGDVDWRRAMGVDE